MLILVCWVFIHLYNFHVNEQNNPDPHTHVSPVRKGSVFQTLGIYTQKAAGKNRKATWNCESVWLCQLS